MSGRDPVAIAELDRRGFLRLGAAAAAAGLLPLGCLAPPRRERVVEALVRRIAGPAAASAIDAGRLDPAAALAPWLAGLGSLADTLEMGLAALEWGVWPLLPKLRPFSALDGGAQDELLASLRDSRFNPRRQIFVAAKLVACVAWYSGPESDPLVGYPGPFAGPGAAMTWSDGA